MEKKYQVFVSSTYEDLKEERQEIIQALLELRAIPVGMELFPAANEAQWSLIKRAIDDCDYYIVVIGGRYGSLGPDGLSYTEMEYRYALDKEKPILGFIHEAPTQLSMARHEQDPDKQNKLNIFRELVKTRMCQMWTTPENLGGKVSRSLINLIRDYPAIGWIRGDQVIGEDAAKEMLRLRNRIDELEENISFLESKPPEGSQKLKQGNDELTFDITITHYEAGKSGYARETAFYDTIVPIPVTINELFLTIATSLLSECPQPVVYRKFRDILYSRAKILFFEQSSTTERQVKTTHIELFQLDKVIIQLKALGLIDVVAQRKVIPAGQNEKSEQHWKLSLYGERVMTQMLAMKK